MLVTNFGYCVQVLGWEDGKPTKAATKAAATAIFQIKWHSGIGNFTRSLMSKVVGQARLVSIYEEN